MQIALGANFDELKQTLQSVYELTPLHEVITAIPGESKITTNDLYHIEQPENNRYHSKK